MPRELKTKSDIVQYKRSCAGKTQHKSKTVAEYFLINEHSSNKNDSEVYKCRFCFCYHIGRIKKLKPKTK